MIRQPPTPSSPRLAAADRMVVGPVPGGLLVAERQLLELAGELIPLRVLIVERCGRIARKATGLPAT